MEGMDNFSASNPFAVEEYHSETTNGWDSSAAIGDGAATATENGTNGVGSAPSVDGSSGEAEHDFAAPAAGSEGPLDQARQLAGDLATALHELSQKLDESDAERTRTLSDSAELQRQIASLEEHKAAKEKMVESVLHGPGGALSSDELQTIQAMMDALKQDPDRLTVLFTVVQHAGELATIISDYTELRRLADQA